MPHTTDAEDHLRIIRSLMEKATIYRAISAQAALIGGVLACIAGGLLAGSHDVFLKLLEKSQIDPANREVFGFQLKWFVVLVLTGAANFYFLYRDALRRGEAFVSPGMKTALTAMTPALFAGGVFSTLWSVEGMPQIFMIFYGLALLSTAHFAPRSLIRLGWAFLLSGLALVMLNGKELLHLVDHVTIPDRTPKAPPPWTYPDALMACTFGAYHLIYAACTTRRAPAPAAVPAI